MKIRKIRIDHCDVSHGGKVNAAPRLALRGSMHPHAIKNNVIRCASLLNCPQSHNRSVGVGSRDFKPDKPIVIGSGQKNKRPSILARVLDFRRHVARSAAVVVGTAWQGSDSRITRGKPSAFGRQIVILCARAQNDPVRIVARSVGEAKHSGENRARFEFQNIAAVRRIDRLL